MGKRRDRRMAAMSNAGRRVKLDLFAEPSGDLGGSSGQDEGEGDVNSKHHDGLPNSPSSSGQKRENPLLLLGQYSDDETDEEPKKSRSSDAPVDSSLADHIDQVEGSTFESEEMGPNLNKDVVSQVGTDSTSPDCLPKSEESDVKVNRSASGDLCKEMEAGEENHVTGTFDTKVVGDISSGWKIVMHEETNQYYYWNVDTGETSWEVPEVLAQAANSSVDHSYSTATDEIPNPGYDGHESNHNLTTSAGEDGGSASLEDIGYENTHLACPSLKMDQYGPSREDGLIDKHKGSQEFPLATDDWVALIRRSENLLQKLKSSISYEGLNCDHERILRYIIEIETRQLDMKSLASYGASLHPFWVHSNMQLERLEFAIDEVLEMVKSKYGDAVKETRDEKSEESEKVKFEADPNRPGEVCSTTETADISTKVDASTAQDRTAVLYDDVTVEHFSSSPLPTRQVGGIAEGGELTNRAVLSDGSVLTASMDAGEDVDMDVDMELEDVAPLAVQSSLIPAKPDVVDPSLEPSSVATEGEYFVPPPPDEEFIPPPPPDAEQIPPPPPDEPPEPSYPPPQPFTEVEQNSSYPEQYPLSYPNSTYEFFGHNQVASNNFYGHAEGCQVVIPHGSVSYGPLPSNYSDAASLIVNPVEQVAYYNIQDATVPPVPVVSIVESSKFHTPSDSFSFSYSALADTSSSLLPLSSVSTSVISSATENEPPDLPSTSATIEASATTSEKSSMSAPSINTATSAVTVTATSVDSKVRSKVLRSKKRTVAVAPSLRSNKKVSSLVDKWKAAKEELQEDEEDEAKSALAMLEKKRQREIEEWHAQQIASGEAKVNANFQPLGGDWRERVKRRRAQAGSKAGQNQKQKDDGNQQPDIVELNQNLPSGWQAYWDESTKQVYYGNLITSETTWTRPTK